MPNPAGIHGDLFEAAMSFDAVGPAIDDLRFRTRARVFVIFFKQ